MEAPFDGLLPYVVQIRLHYQKATKNTGRCRLKNPPAQTRNEIDSKQNRNLKYFVFMDFACNLLLIIPKVDLNVHRHTYSLPPRNSSTPSGQVLKEMFIYEREKIYILKVEEKLFCFTVLFF